MPERKRIVDITSITSERTILKEYLKNSIRINTKIERVKERKLIPNIISQNIVGLFRSEDSRKAIIADIELINLFKAKIGVPSFLEAGPRKMLSFDPRKVRIAIATTGGIAPGLNCVIHSIVKRHTETYSMDIDHGNVFGVYNSFQGLCDLSNNMVELNTRKTEEWLSQGGSKLGMVRYYIGKGVSKISDIIAKQLDQNSIDILYIIGGDGSLKVVNEIAKKCPTRSIVGIPKTMDNDILWVWQSFGFDTAVEQATRTINTLRTEAEATRRICLIELFGAESGFVAANATLASVHVDAVLIPEIFKTLDKRQSKKYLDSIVEHIAKSICFQRQNPYGIIVVAEGVGSVLEKKGIILNDEKITKANFIEQFKIYIGNIVIDAHGQKVPVFPNQPRHNIRAIPANSHDQIYCERLGALAVDNALAGYTNFMISNWLTEFVLVPTNLVTIGKKGIPVNGMFWKQVVSKTGQPLSPAEIVE